MPEVTRRDLTRSNMRARTREKRYPSRTKTELKVIYARQEALNLCTGSGCGDCCGVLHLEEDGRRLACGLLESYQKALDPEEVEAAQGCGVPALYNALFDGERTAVTLAEIYQACPFLGGEEGDLVLSIEPDRGTDGMERESAALRAQGEGEPIGTQTKDLADPALVAELEKDAPAEPELQGKTLDQVKGGQTGGKPPRGGK